MTHQLSVLRDCALLFRACSRTCWASSYIAGQILVFGLLHTIPNINVVLYRIHIPKAFFCREMDGTYYEKYRHVSCYSKAKSGEGSLQVDSIVATRNCTRNTQSVQLVMDWAAQQPTYTRMLYVLPNCYPRTA